MKIYKFINKSIQIHANKYDYSKVDYKNNKIKVCIICPKHGEFWQTPDKHINRKQGCPKCSKQSYKYSTEEFIEKVKGVHGNKYDYSKVEYVNTQTKICIICPIHGEFWQRPYCHLQGNGCPKCNHQSYLSSTEEFIEKAKNAHGNKYDYSKVEYVNSQTKVCIICPEHGEFWQNTNGHLKGCGCPKCGQKRNITENKLLHYLYEHLNGVNIIYQFRDKDMFGLQSLDFYLPEYKIAIECQGRQHFEPVDYFGGEDYFFKTIERDNRKFRLCEKYDIKLIYYYEDDKHKTPKLNSKIITNKVELVNLIKKQINLLF